MYTLPLRELPRHLPLPAGARVHDAGCGLGDGLKAWREAYPAAQLSGIEWSWLWWAVARLRCPWARVRRGDIWAACWGGSQLVSLFQRPESMPRAMDKAARELRSGSWLVSLEFEAVGWAHRARLQNVDGKPVWLYRAPFQRR